MRACGGRQVAPQPTAAPLAVSPGAHAPIIAFASVRAHGSVPRTLCFVRRPEPTLTSPATLPATRYRIAPRDLHEHLFEVACTVDAPAADGQRFRLPTWVPGSYLVREFARNFVAVRAECAGRPVALVKEAKDTWRAAPCPGPLTIIADVYAFDLSVRTAYLDASRAYFNGGAVFLCPEGREQAPCVVDIVAPEGAEHAAWRVATTLPRDGAPAWGFGRHRASDYDELIDHPVEMGSFESATFVAGGVPHDLAVTGRQRADLARVAADLARICQWQCDLFGGAPGSRAPFDRYLFLVTAVGDGYGGLEHRSSTSLLCKRDNLPAPGAGAIGDDYLDFLGLASHEYFHSWNVKRIKPATFVPYDLAREGYTRQLWAFEGITSYYDDLALVRSGVIAPERYLELLGRMATDVLRTPGRRRQSVAESSFDAWIKFYRPDENSPNAAISYYRKGALVALALDLSLRRDGSSLDALMRALWQRYGATGVGVPEDGIARLASELGKRDYGDFFARCVDGTEDPPLVELLTTVGVNWRIRCATGPKDRGGTPAEASAAPRTWLGAKWAATGELRLLNVFTGGPAARAGLAANDVVVAIDGLRASAENLEALATRRQPGEVLALHAFRRDELLSLSLTLDAAPEDTAWLAFTDAPATALAARRSWLGA
jgi:predicted metalloprotease with PDZ domain